MARCLARGIPRRHTPKTGAGVEVLRSPDRSQRPPISVSVSAGALTAAQAGPSSSKAPAPVAEYPRRLRDLPPEYPSGRLSRGTRTSCPWGSRGMPKLPSQKGTSSIPEAVAAATEEATASPPEELSGTTRRGAPATTWHVLRASSKPADSRSISAPATRTYRLRHAAAPPFQREFRAEERVGRAQPHQGHRNLAGRQTDAGRERPCSRVLFFQTPHSLKPRRV